MQNKGRKKFQEKVDFSKKFEEDLTINSCVNADLNQEFLK